VLRQLARELETIEARVRLVEAQMRPAIGRASADWRESARNLAHYVGLRQLDLGPLQQLLQRHGLSSLGRSECFALASLLDVRMRVAESLVVTGEAPLQSLAPIAAAAAGALDFETGEYLLHQHTRQVLGPRPGDRHVYIMVTAPSAREGDKAWMSRMLRAGMNVLRINSAHEGPQDWAALVGALDLARRDTGLPCKVLVDLAGPKIRVGPLEAGHHVASWKTTKDVLGRVRVPARVPVRPASAPGEGPAALVDDIFLARLEPGDRLRFRDSRGKKRTLRLKRKGGEWWGESEHRVWLLDGARLEHRRGRRTMATGVARLGGAGGGAIEVRQGDTLWLTTRAEPGRPARRSKRDRVIAPALVSCTLPEALRDLHRGHRVLLDDGAIEAVVEDARKGRYRLVVVRTSKAVVKLRAEKGINLPDSDVPVSSLTTEDRAVLAFAGPHADLIGLSFVRRPEDVHALHRELRRRGIEGKGIVLKIETRRGFENLPRILFEALRHPPVAVMIARGDLAVEAGYERLAEIQEEILWLCEAAHVPAIWATQVLDQLARTGVPSRAEVSDAAMSVAAECVMLNKGPFVEEAVKVLAGILRRMEKHHYKKRSIFRRLHVSQI
jgi:pyruvate kinase